MTQDFNYSDLNLKTNTKGITFKFQDQEIEIFEYLPLEYKYDVIMCSLHDADERGVYNYIKLDAYFHLNLFLSFVKNINFSQDDMADKLKLYNEIQSSGLMDAFLAAVPEREYRDCLEALTHMEETVMKYRNTAGAALQALMEQMPKVAGEASQLIDQLGPENMGKLTKLAEMFQLAKNG